MNYRVFNIEYNEIFDSFGFKLPTELTFYMLVDRSSLKQELGKMISDQVGYEVVSFEYEQV